MKSMTNGLRITAIALGTVVPLETPLLAWAQNTPVHYLTVRKLTPLGFTNAQADNMFFQASMGTIWDTGDWDVPCDHAFSRSGNVENFSSPSGYTCGSIDSQSEMDACQAAPGFVKVVDSITACGGLVSVAVIGCAPQPGTSMILERDAAAGPLAGPLLNHEFGHNVNLGHLFEQGSGWVGTDIFIMNWVISEQSLRILDWQCTSFRTDSISPNGSNMMPGEGGGVTPRLSGLPRPTSEVASHFSSIPIERLARMYFVDRDPIEAADFYTAEDADKLVTMLRDPANAPYKQTIMALLAIISQGEASHAQALIDVASDGPKNDPSTNAAVVGLGMLANKGSSRALRSLLELVEDPDPDRSDVAISGLSLTAKSEAVAKLQELRGRARGTRAGVLDESIARSDAIRARGLRAYYGR